MALALIQAAKSNDVQRLESLLASPAVAVNIDISDATGSAALHWACRKGHAKVVEVLVKHGADIGAMNKSGRTAEHLARIGNYPDILRIIESHRNGKLKPQVKLVVRAFDTGRRDDDGAGPALVSNPVRGSRPRPQNSENGVGSGSPGRRGPAAHGSPRQSDRRANRQGSKIRDSSRSVTSTVSLSSSPNTRGSKESRRSTKPAKLSRREQAAGWKIAEWFLLNKYRSTWIRNKGGAVRKPVWFVLGLMGAGRSTLCAHLTKLCLRLQVISVGDLARAEVRGVGQHYGTYRRRRAHDIEAMLSDHEMLPLMWVMDLIERAMFTTTGRASGFIFDGFPRTRRQAAEFESRLGKPTVVLHLSCSVSEAQRRLTASGKYRPDEIRTALQLHSDERVAEMFASRNAVYYKVKAGGNVTEADVLDKCREIVTTTTAFRQETAAVKLQASYRGHIRNKAKQSGLPPPSPTAIALFEPRQSKPERTQPCKNRAFVYLMPYAVSKKTRAFLKKRLQAAGCVVATEGRVTARQIKAKEVFEIQNQTAYDAAFVEEPATLQIPTDLFHAKFGIGWRAVLESKRLYNSIDAVGVLNLTFKDLHELWTKADADGKVHRLAPGVMCGYLKAKGKQALYVINGHIPAMYETLVSSGASVYYYVVTWDAAVLSYADFMANVVGDDTPGLALEGSLRATLSAKWAALQLAHAPSSADSGMYASTSPFRALVDVCTWLGVDLPKDSFGRRLIEEGLEESELYEWFRDPIAKNPDSVTPTGSRAHTMASLCEILANHDAEDCVSLCSRMAHAKLIGEHQIFSGTDAIGRSAEMTKRAQRWKARVGESVEETNQSPQKLSAFIHALEGGSAWSCENSRATGSDAGSDQDSGRRSSLSSASSVGRGGGFGANDFLRGSDKPPSTEEQIFAKYIRKSLHLLKELPGFPTKESHKKSASKSTSKVDTGKSRGIDKKHKPRLPSLPNAGLVIIDPSAVCDKFIQVVRKALRYFGGVVRSAGYISAEEMASRRIIDQHFYRVADEAILHTPAGLDMPRMKFERKFGESWRSVMKAGRTMNALDAMAHLKMSDASLSRAWQRAVEAKDFILVSGTTLCARLVDQRKQSIYVINGQYMTTRAQFTEKGAQVYYLSVKWDPKVTSWHDFYQMVTGHCATMSSLPVDVAPESIQGILLTEWKTLGLSNPATSPLSRDLVYFSGSALQGMADRVNWLDVPISADSFGRELLDADVDETTVRRFRNDPLLQDGCRLFDEVLGLDVAACLKVCISVSTYISRVGSSVAGAPSELTAGQLRRAIRPTIKRSAPGIGAKADASSRLEAADGKSRPYRISFSDQGDDSGPDDAGPPKEGRRSGGSDDAVARPSWQRPARVSVSAFGDPAPAFRRPSDDGDSSATSPETTRRTSKPMALTRRAKAENSPAAERKRQLKNKPSPRAGRAGQYSVPSLSAHTTQSRDDRAAKCASVPRNFKMPQSHHKDGRRKKVSSLELETARSRVSSAASGTPSIF